MSANTDPLETAILKAFGGYAMQVISEKYLNCLREYVRANPGQKQEVIKAVEFFLLELKCSK
jgi:hypothetical protein